MRCLLILMFSSMLANRKKRARKYETIASAASAQPPGLYRIKSNLLPAKLDVASIRPFISSSTIEVECSGALFCNHSEA